MVTSILSAIFESFIFSFTMFGVAHRREVRPVYQHALFVLLNTVMLYFLELNSLWELITFFIVMLSAYTTIFDVDLKTTALGGVSTYIFVTINQLVSALLGLLAYQERVDYRLMFRSQHWPILLFSAIFAVAMIVMYNMFIALPRRKSKTRFSFTDLTVRINVMLSMVLIFMLSWNIRYLYRNWENVNAVPGLSSKIIVLVLFAAGLVGSMMLVVNRYLMKSMLLNHVSETSQRDIMTGTLNRDAGLATLKDMMKASRETGAQLTLCFVDINNLKFVNDKFGHHEGDRLIEIVSATISDSLRNRDVVARLGGDEFIVIFAGCDVTRARVIWSRILDQFKKINLSGELNFPVGISSGFVEYDPEKHATTKQLLREADEKMYKDKKSRRSYRNSK